MEKKFLKESDPEIEVSIAKESDILGIQEVFYKTWLATYPNEDLGITEDDVHYVFRDAFSKKTLQKRREKLSVSNASGKVLVAKDGDKVVGICRVAIHEDENRLQTLYVLPEYQRTGVGKSLWNEGKKFLDRKKKTIVRVASYNKQAIDFYKKIGFKETGKHWEDEKRRMKSGAIIPELEMEMGS